MKDHIRRKWIRLTAFFSSRTGKRWLRSVKFLVQALIVGILLWQIWQIGWREILTALPAHPLFYLLFLVLYFTLPVTEYFTYNIRWPIRFMESQAAFLKKRIYNKVVFGYSGEVHLYFWLQHKAEIPRKEAYELVRDNNILSTFASTSVAVTLLLVLTGMGLLDFGEWIAIDDMYAILPFAAVMIAAGLFLFKKYRQFLFTMPLKPALIIFGLHAGRMLLLTVVQILQWYVVMPWVALEIWFTMIVLQLILSRIPFLPSKDLVFIGASLEYVRHVAVPAAGIAGLLLVNQMLDKAMNLVIFFVLALRDSKGG
jgi:hypothetical protein